LLAHRKLHVNAGIDIDVDMEANVVVVVTVNVNVNENMDLKLKARPEAIAVAKKDRKAIAFIAEVVLVFLRQVFVFHLTTFYSTFSFFEK